MDKTTLKTLTDDELSTLELLVIAEGDRRFEVIQKAAEKNKNKKFQKEKKRMAEIEKTLNGNVKIEWNGIKLTLSRSYLPQEGFDELEYWVQKYSGPLIFNNDNGGSYSPSDVRQIAPQLVKGDMKLVKEYYGLREKVEGN
jgi:hypothetical protein